MGGRGSSYYETKNAQIEEKMRQALPQEIDLEELLNQLKKLGNPQKRIQVKPDPESKRNDYLLFKKLKSFGISTRASTDSSTLENLKPHQEQLIKLSSKYDKITKTITLNNEIEFSKDSKTNAYGYLVPGEYSNGKIFIRLVLNDIVIDDSDYFVHMKNNAIKRHYSVEVDSDKIKLYTTTHEFGHYLEENLFRKQYNKLNNLSINYSNFSNLEATRIKNEVIKIKNKKFANLKDSSIIEISDYSKTNNFEWFAETFTNLELSSNPQPIALALGEYLKEELKT